MYQGGGGGVFVCVWGGGGVRVMFADLLRVLGIR